MQLDSHSVLVVTKDNKISSVIQVMLQAPYFSLIIVSDFNEARRRIGEYSFDIVIVDSGDGSDTEFAMDISDSNSSVILLVPQENFDQISYRAEPFGIITAAKPFDGFYFYNMIKVAIAFQYKIQKLTSQTIKLKERMEEIRIVNRAKMLLMQKYSMTEDEAHHHLEKMAMDKGLKRISIAKQIIESESQC